MGMSGGIDSSIAVWLLQQAGYTVTGVTFRLADRYIDDRSKQSRVIERAKAVCERFGIEHISADYTGEFGSCVVDYFTDAYFRGLTPNPCVRCNREIKWRSLCEMADKLNIQLIATGHYARVEKQGRRFLLKKGKDGHKDQSYFLWRLDQTALARTVFPLGNYTKVQIREIAAELGLEQAQQPESQDICFIPENDYKHFLEKYHAERAAGIGEGDFIDMQGSVIGRHQGFWRFTVGQRKGLGMALGEPAYVKAIYPETNRVQIGNRMDSESLGCIVDDCNWIAVPAPEESVDYSVKVRYRNKGVSARLEPLDNGRYHVFFSEPVHGVTPGQSAVFYEHDTLIGGGLIQANRQET